MVSILSLTPRMFRTRNPARDQQTDLERMTLVRSALEEVIASAEREHAGLQQRIDAYYAQAATVLDNSGAYGDRSSEDEEIIRTAEGNAAAATARVRQIEAQIEQFSAMLRQLDAAVSASVA